MDRLQRRRNLRAERELTNRHARFIVDYVKVKHNRVYMEADQTYKYIQGKNPDKKDMRKTDEFMRITTPYKNLRAYYERRGRKTAGNSEQHEDRTQHEDNMVLNIELMPLQGTQHQTPPPEIQHEAPPPETQHEAPPPEIQHQTPPPEIQHESPPPEIQHQTPPPEIQHEAPPPEIQHEAQQLLLPAQQLLLPDHLFEELLQEIRKDPDLYKIFNDIDIMDDECQQVSNTEGEGGNDDMWDVFNICNEPTPLELELAHIC